MEFIEAPLFTQLLPEYLTDDEYAELQLYLANDPEAGDVIPGTGGFRKAPHAVWKDEAADLTASEKRLLRAAVDEEKKQRARRRVARRK